MKKSQSAAMRRQLGKAGPPLLVAAGIVGVWYLITYVVLDPARRFLMPAPHTVVTEAFLDADVRGEIGDGLLSTAQVAFTGLAAAVVIGVLWAIAMNHAEWWSDRCSRTR